MGKTQVLGNWSYLCPGRPLLFFTCTCQMWSLINKHTMNYE